MYVPLRRHNVSSSPYLPSRALDSSASPAYDPIDEHGFPAHDPHSPNPTTANTPSEHDDSDVEDVLAPGDIVGKGSLLKGDVVSLLPTDNDEDEDEQFHVIKELGKGSYAVVYLVHQVPRGAAPSRGRANTADTSEDGHILGHMDSEEPLAKPAHQPAKTYGRHFAIKCLSKANLDKEGLGIQMTEVTIHQSLPVHPNIVALHKTLQTSSYLLLVLEYVPGEDLFYFLQQARDHYPSFPPESCSQETLLQQQQTPPTPSLLSSCHPSHLLSRSRLRLIASMFAQMCDAVATCHAVGVFHRDIKPENFIVTDGRYVHEGPDRVNGAMNKGRVVVKLTDFGLSTREEECSDMDCGSAPYMSYECRNNTAPTYRPREADVWSLGIVLINMLYHINPWTDTAHGACPSFTAFREDPVGFFTKLFTGMTPHVAEVLAWRVFGLDSDHTRANGKTKEKQMTAADLGVWVRSSLVDLLAMDESASPAVGGGVNGGTSTSRVAVNGGHRLSLQMRLSHLPVSRAASPFGRLLGSVGGVGALGVGGAVSSPRLLAMSLSRAASLAPALEKEEAEGGASLQIQEEIEPDESGEQDQEQVQEEQADATPSRTSTKRRRRGLRNKTKGPTSTPPVGKVQDQQHQDEALKSLADVQMLVREISNVSKPPSVHQLQLQHQQPSSSSVNHLNGDGNRISFVSTLSSGESGETSEDVMVCGSGGSGTTLTTAPSMMSMVTEAMTRTTTTTTGTSLKSSAGSTRSTSNGGSSLRSATTIGAGGGRSKARQRRNYEPVPMYAVPSALLSKPMAGGEGGGRTPSQLSSSSGTRSVAGSGSGTHSQLQQQPQELQPKAVVKKSSKWMLRWKNNNNSGSGGNSGAAPSAATSSVPIPSPTSTTPTPAVATPELSSTQDHARSTPRPVLPIGLPGHISAFRTFPATSSASDASPAQGRDQARTLPRSRLIPMPAPGHVVTFPASSSTTESVHPTVMSSTATNVTDLIMGLNPPSRQINQNASNVSLVGSSGSGGGYAPSTTPWKRGRRGKGGTGDSMAILSGAAAGNSPKSSSRSPGPSGFGSSASSSNVSLASGVGSGVDLGQDSPVWYWRDKRTSDRLGMERGMGYSGGVGSGVSGARGVGVRSPGGATGLGAGGGRHGSVGAAGGPFASTANSLFGSSGSWRANNAMGTSMGASMGLMNANATSASGRASLLSASGTASPGASTIAFTRFSNSSVSTMATMATTISTGSGTANWRNGARGGGAVAMTSSAVADTDGGLGVGAAGTSTLGGKTNSYAGPNLPKSVKTIDGISTLNELPGGQHSNPDFMSPPAKKTRTRNKKGNKSINNNIVNGATSSAQTTPTATDTPMIAIDGPSSNKDLNPHNVSNKLDTIIERPLAPDSSIGQQADATTTIPSGVDGPSTWKEASTSTTDLVTAANDNTTSAAAIGVVSVEGGGRIKKVHKGQINTLAKMLSALRR